MKVMKFRRSLSDHILTGEKKVTWRLYDDKNLQKGDEVSFCVWETQEEFARARLRSVSEKRLDALTDEDFIGHERYKNDAEMYKILSQYYGRVVGPDTCVKIVTFEIL
jgi:hypothetical protein